MAKRSGFISKGLNVKGIGQLLIRLIVIAIVAFIGYFLIGIVGTIFSGLGFFLTILRIVGWVLEVVCILAALVSIIGFLKHL